VEGIWYPKGGFHKVVEALINIGQRHGVVYSPSTTVSRVTLSPDNRTVTGVEAASGGHIEADIVICNADLVYAYNNLLPQTNYAKRLSKRAQSCSSVSFYWSLSQIVPQLDIHNIFLAEKYKESFDDIFHGVGVPGEPSFYVNVPSRIDPSAAPAGKDAVVVLVPVASLKNPSSKSPDLTSSVDVAALRKSILTTIQARTGVSLSELIISETINTPESWQEQFNLYSGSILGLSHSFFNVLSFRPRIKHDNIKGLYFVGASTHPGTGVPVCLAGSGVTAAQVLKDLGVPETTGQPTQTIKAVRKLDQIEKSDGILQVLLLTIVSVVVLLAALKSASVFVNGITTMTRDQFSSLPMSPLLWPVVLLVSVMVGFTFFLRSQEPRRTLQKDW
jgi:phytoene desaturase (3,4-didehydrolycopene-forming)